MAPVGGCFARVKAFTLRVARHEHGMVAHALAAAVKILLKEYLVLVSVQFDTANAELSFFLQKGS
jgi:hypothetical protein